LLVVRAAWSGATWLLVLLATVLLLAACKGVLGLDEFDRVACADCVPVGDPLDGGPVDGSVSDGAVDGATGRSGDGGDGVDPLRKWARWRVSGPTVTAPTRFVPSGSEIRDSVTGLVWHGEVFAAESLAAAATACARLGDGWSVPTRIELLSIVDTSRRAPAIDTAAFPRTPSARHFTQSVFGSSGEEWTVDFFLGRVGRGGGTNVRCVRPPTDRQGSVP
jgi:hypothetical protein